jgi:hypothetical protein
VNYHLSRSPLLCLLGLRTLEGSLPYVLALLQSLSSPPSLTHLAIDAVADLPHKTFMEMNFRCLALCKGQVHFAVGFIPSSRMSRPRRLQLILPQIDVRITSFHVRAQKASDEDILVCLFLDAYSRVFDLFLNRIFVTTSCNCCQDYCKLMSPRPPRPAFPVQKAEQSVVANPGRSSYSGTITTRSKQTVVSRMSEPLGEHKLEYQVFECRFYMRSSTTILLTSLSGLRQSEIRCSG